MPHSPALGALAGLARRSPVAAGLGGLLLFAAIAAPLASGAPGGGGTGGPEAALFFSSERRTTSADVATGADGSLHAVFSEAEAGTESSRMTYAHCAGPAADCGRLDSWSLADLGPGTARMQVALTPEGAPRILARRDGDGGADEILYGACDRDCGTSAGWRLGAVATSEMGPSGAFEAAGSERTFALDAEGRPRFVYSDRNYHVEPDHYGTFWMRCDRECTTASNWTETDIARHAAYDTEIFDAPALALTADGRPRLVARIFAFDEAGEDAEDGLYFLACDENCESRDGWRRHLLTDTGSGSYPGPGWDLALDAADRPHVAFFAGSGTKRPELDHRLIYLACASSACLEDADWQATAVTSAGEGEDPSLALDAQGRPRIAFLAGGSVALAACDENCTAEEAPWRGAVAEDDAALRASHESALPFTCDTSLWTADAPRLTLDAAGAAHIAYDVSIEGRCWERGTNPSDPASYFTFNNIWRGARWLAAGPA